MTVFFRKFKAYAKRKLAHFPLLFNILCRSYNLLRYTYVYLLKRITSVRSIYKTNNSFLDELLTKDIAAKFISDYQATSDYREVMPGITVSPVVLACYTSAIYVESSTVNYKNLEKLNADLEIAEGLLRRAIKLAPLWIDLPRALGRNLWFQAKYTESMTAFNEGEKLRNILAKNFDWPIDNCVYLPRNCTEVIGLTAHLDAFVKYKILTNDRREYYLLAGPQQIINEAFLEYWKPYINIVTDPLEIQRLSKYESVYGVNWNWIMPRDGKVGFAHEIFANIQHKWHLAGNKPLLSLKQSHVEILNRIKDKWGMSQESKFICLHVRSEGFYGGNTGESAQRFRNTSIEVFYPLINMLVDMGYWVIRMGDSSMPKLDFSQLNYSNNVIDYALSSEKSAELDIALCASCELFVGGPSGLNAVTYIFGGKVCVIDYPLNNGIPWSNYLFAPKLYYSHHKNRVLTFEEVISSDIVYHTHNFLLERDGISLIPNESDEIVEIVREALFPDTYKINDDVANQITRHFVALNHKYKREMHAKLSKYFAVKHASLLLEPKQIPEESLAEC